jgi:hypothetical protein
MRVRSLVPSVLAIAACVASVRAQTPGTERQAEPALQAASAGAEAPLRIAFEPDAVCVTAGERPILRYRYDNVPFKPYVGQLWTPAGVQVLRDAPHDHLHHHALMFAVAVDGVNYWEEKDKCGRQIHRAFSNVVNDEKEGVRRAAFTEQLEWTPDGKDVALSERRTIEVYAAGDLGATLVTWRSVLTAPPKKASAVLSGMNYYGLGARFLTSMDKGGTFLLPDGKAAVLMKNDVRAPWCAYAAEADGKPVTLAMFDRSKNPRHPASWFTMTTPFAYLCATVNLDDEPLTLAAAQPVTLSYGVGLFDGKPDAARIAKLHERWETLSRDQLPRPQR